MKYYSPLRYPGGKAKFAPFIAKVMKDNSLSGHYLEPYAGGAGVALHLLLEGIVPHIHINDADPALYDFWITVTKFPEELLRLIRNTPINMEQWYHWRSVLQHEIDVSQAERGFATLFLNRTNRSGILKGGVIGGKNQSGNYRLDARYKKEDIIRRIEAIASVANYISVYNEDALYLLKRCDKFLPDNSLIYLDPPYYVKGKGLYRNFYEHEDHMSIADFLCNTSFDIPWVVSYDNVPEICEMYHASQKFTYQLRYTAQKRYLGSEIMFFSDKIRNISNLTA